MSAERRTSSAPPEPLASFLEKLTPAQAAHLTAWFEFQRNYMGLAFFDWLAARLKEKL